MKRLHCIPVARVGPHDSHLGGMDPMKLNKGVRIILGVAVAVGEGDEAALGLRR